MRQKKVSIIVPYYNTDIETYKKCQDSICNQTYANIEVIVVDDGSRNDYAKNLEEVAALDTRIRVIHKLNGGVSSARNIGLQQVTGAYVAFIDSDDWVETNFIETLVNELETNNVQISVVDVLNEYGTEVTINNTNCETKIIAKHELYDSMLSNSERVFGYLCNKLYKSELLCHTLNEKYHYCEDLVFNALYFQKIQYAAVSSAKLYHYRLGAENSTSNLSYNHRILTLIQAYKEVESIYQIECPEKIVFIRCAILKQALNIRARFKVAKACNIIEYNDLMSIISEYWDAYARVTLLEKVNIKLTLKFPILLFKIKSCLHKIIKR